jgi:hypothetical protein
MTNWVGFEVLTALLVTWFHAGFLHDLFFDPEDEGDRLLRNFG